MLKRKPGRPPKAPALAAVGQVTIYAPPPQVHADSQPRPSVALSRCRVPSGLLALAARQLGRCAYSSTWVECVASYADGRETKRHAPRMLTAHGGTISVSTSWVHQFIDQELNWSFWVSRVGPSCGIACAEGSTNKPKASQKMTAKAASNEGASTTIGRRRGSPHGSKNKPRIGHAAMQKAKVQAKANA
eukprot:365751-Chlamydomonas_euryale.AAC.3